MSGALPNGQGGQLNYQNQPHRGGRPLPEKSRNIQQFKSKRERIVSELKKAMRLAYAALRQVTEEHHIDLRRNALLLAIQRVCDVALAIRSSGPTRPSAQPWKGNPMSAQEQAISHWPEIDELIAKAKRLADSLPRPIRRDKMKAYLDCFETCRENSAAACSCSRTWSPGSRTGATAICSRTTAPVDNKPGRDVEIRRAAGEDGRRLLSRADHRTHRDHAAVPAAHGPVRLRQESTERRDRVEGRRFGIRAASAMSADKYVLAIDLGTSGCKAGLHAGETR